jgi:hypothetical protein
MNKKGKKANSYREMKGRSEPIAKLGQETTAG